MKLTTRNQVHERTSLIKGAKHSLSIPSVDPTSKKEHNFEHFSFDIPENFDRINSLKKKPKFHMKVSLSLSFAPI